jgi:dihydropteroate synthase
MASPRTLDCRGRRLVLGERMLLMGILNVTPDSFYDGGQFAAPEIAFGQAGRLVAEGADLVDLGGQSTRPGNRPELPAAEEIARILPVLEPLVAALPAPVSVDTYRPEVARAALRAGAHLINDIRGFQGDPAMAEVVAEYGCPAVLMHFDRGFSGAPGDAIGRILAYFERSLGIAARAGIPPGRLVLDPGIGFAKTAEESLEIMGRLDELKVLGLPLLLGASRKSPLGHVLGLPPAERLEATLATTVLAVVQGVELVRVHDVAANGRAARVAEAVLARRPSARQRTELGSRG